MALNLRTTDELYTFMECMYRWRARYYVNLVTLEDAIEWALDMSAITVMKWAVEGQAPDWPHIEARLTPVDKDRAHLDTLTALHDSWSRFLRLQTEPYPRPGVPGSLRIAGGNCRVPCDVLAFVREGAVREGAVCYAHRRTMDSAADYWLPAVALGEAQLAPPDEAPPAQALFVAPKFLNVYSTINDRGAAANLPAKDPEKHSDQESLRQSIEATGADPDDYSTILAQLPTRWDYLFDVRLADLDQESARRRIYHDLRHTARSMKLAMREDSTPRSPGAHCATCPYREQCRDAEDYTRMKRWPGVYVLPEKEFTWTTWLAAVEELSAQDVG